MAVASPCALASRLTSRLMARPMVTLPRSFGSQVRVRPMSAIAEKHEDSAVNVHVDEKAVEKKGGKKAVQRRRRRAAPLDISPFGKQFSTLQLLILNSMNGVMDNSNI